jgi:hypothetical protein
MFTVGVVQQPVFLTKATLSTSVDEQVSRLVLLQGERDVLEGIGATPFLTRNDITASSSNMRLRDR